MWLLAYCVAVVAPPSLLHLTRMSIRRLLLECVREEGSEPPRPESYIQTKKRKDAELKEQRMREEAACRELRARQRQEAAELLDDKPDTDADADGYAKLENEEEADAEDEVNEQMVCVKRPSRRERDRDSGLAPSERTSISSTAGAPAAGSSNTSSSSAGGGGGAPTEQTTTEGFPHAAQFGVPPARRGDGDDSPLRIVYRGSRGGIGFFQFRPSAGRSANEMNRGSAAAAAAGGAVERQDSGDGRAARLGRHSESEEESSVAHTPVRLPLKRSSSKQHSYQEQSIEEREETAAAGKTREKPSPDESASQPSAKRRDSSSGSSDSLSLPELDELASVTSAAQSNTQLHTFSPPSSPEMDETDERNLQRFSTPPPGPFPAADELKVFETRPRGASDSMAASASKKRLLRKHRHHRSKRDENPEPEKKQQQPEEQDSVAAVKGSTDSVELEAGARERSMDIDAENLADRDAEALADRHTSSSRRPGSGHSRSHSHSSGGAHSPERRGVDEMLLNDPMEAHLFYMLGIRSRMLGGRQPHGAMRRAPRGEAGTGGGGGSNPNAPEPEVGVEKGHEESDSSDESQPVSVRREENGVPVIGADEELPVDPARLVYKNLLRARVEQLVLPPAVKRYLMFE